MPTAAVASAVTNTVTVSSPPLLPTALSATAVDATAAVAAVADSVAFGAAATPAAAADAVGDDNITFETALSAAREAVDLLRTALELMERRRFRF